MIRRERIYVDPEFKRKLKLESANNGVTIIEYTKNLARNMPSLVRLSEEVRPIEQNPSKRFNFRI